MEVMPRRVFVLAVSAACLGAALLAHTSPLAIAERRGKVVRVERPRAVAADRVQLCGMDTSNSSADKGPSLMCFGDMPRVGADVEFLDGEGYRGRGRVTGAEPGLPGMPGDCNKDVGSTVRFEWVERRGDVGSRGRPSRFNGERIKRGEASGTQTRRHRRR